MSSPTAPPILLPASFASGFTRVFGWWVRRMFRADFFAVRLARENSLLLADLATHPAPVIGVSNHSAWWDPLVFVLLHRRFMPDRIATGPVEAEQWRRFGFMKKLGLFGLDPHDPRSAPLMVDHVLECFRDNPRTNLWITPQAQFVDPREKITIRPGVSMVAAGACQAGFDIRCVSIAIEYVFWVDRRPELLIRLQPVPPTCEARPASRCEQPSASAQAHSASTEFARPNSVARLAGTSTTAWHRAFTRVMRDNQSALTNLSIARDPAAFDTLVGGNEGRVNAAYDLWQRVRGRSGGIKARRFTEPRP